jgi:hypothetical protein
MNLRGETIQERDLQRLRVLRRNYMRNWRADPENRQRERKTQVRWRLNQKVKVLSQSSGTVCGFCYSRPSIQMVERLITTRNGFRRIFVPYCGRC